jgi:UDP-2,3-diacylglucosamine hydrolase
MPLAHLFLPATAVVEVHADVHLHSSQVATAAAWLRMLEASRADAIIILGDWFEVWVGDDWGLQDPLVQRCAALLQRIGQQRAVYFLPGNRDFLLGHSFAQSCGLQLLADPCLLQLGGQRILLTHGDAWVTADKAYQDFRAHARSPAWQHDFLRRPLAERIALGAAMRAQSQAAQAGRSSSNNSAAYDDIDFALACTQLAQYQANTLIHGHTHRPSHDTLAPDLQRWVLSDWDAERHRGDMLRIQAGGIERISAFAI